MKQSLLKTIYIITAFLAAAPFALAKGEKTGRHTNFGTSAPSSAETERVMDDGMSDGSITTKRMLEGSLTPNSAREAKREADERARLGYYSPGNEYRPPSNPAHAENVRELGAFAAKVEFEPGTDILTKESKEEIAFLVAKARSNGKLDKIRVLAWADREYPVAGEKVPRMETRLADERGDAVRAYLKEQLDIGDVDVYNMARRPSAVSRMLRTPETKIKTKAEELGIAPSEADAPSLFSERRRASSALVMAVMDE